MVNYVKHVDGDNTFFLVPVKTDTEGTICLDVTRIMRGAINKDRRGNYEAENGPNFGIEMARAMQHADFLSGECNIHAGNFHKYSNRRGYLLTLRQDV
jgi:homoserine acetyltransferase